VTKEAVKELQKQYPHSWEILDKIPPNVRERGQLVKISPYQQTARKGEPILFVDVLIAGQMRVLNEFESGSVFGFAYLSPLAYIGSYEVVAERPYYSATTESVSECSLIRLKKEDFHSWFQKDPQFTREVAFRMANNICDQSYRHGEILFYPSTYLTADYLIRMFENLEGEPKKILSDRQEIADHLGFSVRTVNRCIRELKEENLVEIEKGKLTISSAQYKQLKNRNGEIKRQL
jgi:CRP/FNR family transcriptional regulator, cyclic AMP receptor protein